MTSRTVQNVIKDQSGVAVANCRCRVFLSGPGFRESDYSEVAPMIEVITSVAGLWQAGLECNDTITPENTYYRVIEEIPMQYGGSREWVFQVLESHPSPVNLYAVLVKPPNPNPAFEDYLTASEADALFLTQAEGDALYLPQGYTFRQNYVHDQMTPSNFWIVDHNLGFKPGGVHVSDSSGSDVEGEVSHVSINQLTIEFASAFSGQAIVS